MSKTYEELFANDRIVDLFYNVNHIKEIMTDEDFKCIDFFLKAEDVTPTCSTNIKAAFAIGKYAGRATGKSALLVEIVWLCVITKDMLQKGVPHASIEQNISVIKDMITAVNHWRVTELNY